MRSTFLVVVALTIGLVACGGSGSTATTSGASTAAPPASAAPVVTPTRAAGTAGTTPSTTNLSPLTPSSAITRTAGGATRTAGSATPASATPGAALPSAPPVKFNPVPWQPGDKTVYAVTARDTGQPAGTATYTLGREFEADTISATLSVNQTQDRFQLGFDTKSLAPVSELRSIVTAGGTIDIQAEFHAGGATVQVISVGGTKRAELTLPAGYLANDQFLVVLRALPFAPGYQGSLVLVPSQGDPPTLAAVVTVTGQEAVATPFGQVQCWRVEALFEGGGPPQVLWYGVDTPNDLVKYDNGRYVYLLSQQP